MLRDYPTYINDIKIPAADSWQESYGTVESVNTTEAGTDVVVLVRSGKLSVSASYSCSSDGAALLASFRDAEPLTVSMYDIGEQGYKARQMRMRNFSAERVEDSGNTPGTVGLWRVSFNLEEY